MPSYDPSTHDDRISIDITLQALSSGRASLTTALAIVDAVTPGGGAYATYSSLSEVTADVTAGNLNTIAQSIATAYFSQPKKPQQLIIYGINTGGGGTYVQGLDAAIAAGLDFFGVLIDSRTVSDQLAVSTDIESKAGSEQYLLFVTQDDDADWKTSGIPAAWSTVEGNEYTAVCYHDDNGADAASDRLDCAWMGNRFAFDPDEASVPWTCRVSQVDALTTALTSTQKGFARANYANTALPKGTKATTWVDPGQTLAGRPVDHIVTAVWLRVRLREDLADLDVDYSDRGVKLTVDQQGQAAVLQVIEKRLQQGVDVKHFTSGTDSDGNPTPAYRITPQAITDADRSAQRLRFDVEAQLATGVLTIQVSTYLSTDALAA